MLWLDVLPVTFLLLCILGAPDLQECHLQRVAEKEMERSTGHQTGVVAPWPLGTVKVLLFRREYPISSGSFLFLKS